MKPGQLACGLEDAARDIKTLAKQNAQLSGLPSLEWVRDLEFFEGPLLSVYKAPDGSPYSGSPRKAKTSTVEVRVSRLPAEWLPKPDVMHDPVLSLDDDS